MKISFVCTQDQEVIAVADNVAIAKKACEQSYHKLTLRRDDMVWEGGTLHGYETRMYLLQDQHDDGASYADFAIIPAPHLEVKN